MELSEVREQLARAGWPPGWTACTHAEERALAVQLNKEVLAGHALHGRECVALAKGSGLGRVLYFVPDDEHPLAVVALTWRVPRGAGEFPWVESFESPLAWAAAMADRA